MDPEQWQAFIASLPAAARARMAANIVANQQAPAPAVAAETARTAGPSPVRSIGEMIAKSAGDAFTLPGRALYGEIPRADEMPQSEAVGEALNFAGMVSTPALRGARSPNTVSMSGASDGPGIKAYHGTPHDFDRFSMDKLGTGEGVQAYGHGLYFAESEDVARAYRNNLSPAKVDGVPAPQARAASSDEAFIFDVLKHERTPENARFRLDRMNKLDLVEKLDEMVASGRVKPGGHMYEVNIKANPDDFLDWDKPLNDKASTVVGKHLEAALDSNQPIFPEVFERFESGKMTGREATEMFGKDTKKLAEAGIPGVRFLDQGSRAAGTGTSNFVVFDDSIIEILRKYGLLGPLGLGAGAVATGSNDGT